MQTRLAIRSIPKSVADGLAALAVEHDRSLESEARYALRAWVEPLVQRKERSARRQEVAGRLTELLHQANATRVGRQRRASHIALEIGENHAEPVERWFTGEEEPSFDQLRRVAVLLGAAEDWLLHGAGVPFRFEEVRIPEEANAGVRWLLSPDTVFGSLQRLCFVRNATRDGSLAIVKIHEGERSRVIRTAYHVSDEIGAGGEGSLARLTIIWYLLYACQGRSVCGASVYSYIVPASTFDELLAGKINPVCIIDKLPTSRWLDDIWDRDQIEKGEALGHWPGWSRTARRINTFIMADTALASEYNAIEKGEHPFLKGVF